MNFVTLVLPPPIAEAMRNTLSETRETGGVLLVSILEAPDGSTRLLGRELHLVDDNAYALRSSSELVVRSEGFVGALSRARQTGASAIWFHTHPGAISCSPSSRDAQVDENLAEPFRIGGETDHYGTLILAGTPASARFSGHLNTSAREHKITRLWEVGPRLRLSLAGDGQPNAAGERDLYDRNVRAFGGAIQTVLSNLNIAVVGCGGTGSPIAEQLTRLGVRSIVLIDPGTMSRSNLTRVYGSTPKDIGENKALVLARHLRTIAPDANVRTVEEPITSELAARELGGCDVVFGCTDDNAGRLVLSRLASYLLTAVIDCGVLLSSTPDGTLTGIDGRVTVLTPGEACLVCRGRIDMRRAQAELMPTAEQERLAREGYAAALPGVEPAVVAFTTAVAAAAVAELLERLTGYGGVPVPGEILLRLHEREISQNTSVPRVKHYCHPDSGKLGLGAGTPFLEQTWAS